MRVVGVDLSAEPVRMAVAMLEWGNGKAVVEELRVGADDEAVLAAAPRTGTRRLQPDGRQRQAAARGTALTGEDADVFPGQADGVGFAGFGWSG